MSEDSAFSFDPAVALALSHSLRVELLEKLQGRVASARELSQELSQPLRKVNYHLRQLQEAGCIVVRHERSVRGAVEYFYTAKPDSFIGSPEWAAVPVSTRERMTSLALGVFLEKLTGTSGGTADRDGTTCTTETFLFDEMGWELATQLIQNTLSRLQQLQEQCEARGYVNEAALIPTIVGLAMSEAGPSPTDPRRE